MLELARPEDRETVNALAQQVHAIHTSWRPDIHDAASELYPAERFQAAVRQRQLYVAKVGAVVVGYVLLQIRTIDGPGMLPCKAMVIQELCVDEMCRGQGIGTEILSDVRALAKAFRCTRLQLEVYPQNDEAVGFFQKSGFFIHTIGMQRNI